ncbi:DUF1186 domain-containing protein [Bradyrhizobium sp. DOA9]|uniref:DUF1186 domain-containing protein n=1 Tax=Bradyrhizobium sp. DOA9 TaxID=1126627 RepID=UPI00046AFA75|nr:DUF1186 domain-containing protein [Bradyrhizobium sp. DOA9]GAJ31057.1 hypothetical protein TC0475 [Bradyrhizobium sp. DOA9]
MDALEILESLNKEKGLPTEAIQAARAQKDSVIPVFLRAFEEVGSPGRTNYDAALFFAFHLLGEWRVNAAYPVLANFLRKPPDIVDAVLGGAVTETTHRVMASVFDGNLQPLCNIIHDEDADEFVRSRMIEAIVLLTLRGDVSRAWSEQFLRECYDRLRPQDCCYVWSGWQQSIAWLGLSSLKPLVERAFAQEFIARSWLSYADFEEDLQYTLDNPDAPPYRAEKELTLFDDTILELSTWASFKPESRPKKQPAPVTFYHPERNPFLGVGRNDPCPCGSGKKFKKCCLNADRAS